MDKDAETLKRIVDAYDIHIVACNDRRSFIEDIRCILESEGYIASEDDEEDPEPDEDGYIRYDYRE
jgi:hypothetical protein